MGNARCLLLVAVGVAVAAAANAQSTAVELITDRPDFTESAVTVPIGTFQFEAGATWSDDGVRTLAGPELLVRWGLRDRLEIRLAAPDWVDFTGGNLRSGLGDAEVSVKARLRRWGPWDLAVLPALTLPTGDTGLTTGAVDPSVALVGARDLGEEWSIAAQLTGAWPTLGRERSSEWTASLSTSTAIGARTSTFLEAAAVLPGIGGTSLVLHHGYTFRVGAAWQVDAHVAAGLEHDAPDLLIGVGLATRL